MELTGQDTRSSIAVTPPSSSIALPDWRRAWGAPPLRVTLRRHPQDFRVDEELGFEPDGEGEHRFLRIEKVNANTAWVAGQLARFAGIDVRHVGYSGLKDRHALTRQWFSVQLPLRSSVDWTGLCVEGVRVLEVSANRRKLRRGVHRSNRFRIVLRDVRGETAPAAARLARISEDGVPNYFGEQRFGRDASNLALAEALMRGRRLPRARRSLALSAARAWLFNHVLDRRVGDDSWRTLRAGDCAGLDGSGSVFAVERPDAELDRRAAARDVHPTGPLWGRGALSTSGEIEALERDVARQFAAFADGLARHGLEQQRRPLRVAVRDLAWQADGDVLELSFRLTRGAFATVVLRELADYRDAAPPPP